MGMNGKIIGLEDWRFEDMASLGAEHTTFLDRACAFLLALSPLLQFYVGPVRNAGFTIMVLIAPLLVLRLAKTASTGRVDTRCMFAVIPMLLFQLFKLFDHGVTINKLVYCVFFLVVFVAAAAGCINVRLLVKYAMLVCLAASALLVVQYFCFYLLGFHLQLAPTSLFLPSSEAWTLGVQTGLYGLRGIKNGFYRPSAFFMEPSHMFLYAFPVLALLLLSRRMNAWRMINAALITVGMILSTSGMGIVVAAGLWGVYIALYRSKRSRKNVARFKNLLTARSIVLIFGALVLVTAMYFTVPVFKKAADRLLQSSPTGQSSAVSGRNKKANELIRNMSGTELVTGVTEDLTGLNFNLPGFHATLYKYGWIGLILSYWFYVQFLFRTRGAGFWISAVILVVSFFSAHTHGTFFLQYYLLVLLNAMYMSGKQPAEEKLPAGAGCAPSGGKSGQQEVISGIN